MAAIPKAFWPVTIVSGSNDKIDFRRSGAGADDVATVVAGTYYSAAALATAVQAALAAAYATGSWSVTVGATGRITVTHSATAFSLKFATGANAAVGPRHLLGFPATDTTSALTVTGTYQHQNGWYAEDPVADDTGDLPAFERAQTVALGGAVKSIEFASRRLRSISLTYLRAAKALKLEEGSAKNESLQRLWESGWARFRWWPDGLVEGTRSDYVLDLESAKAYPRNRKAPGVALYDAAMKLRRYVAPGSVAEASGLPIIEDDASTVSKVYWVDDTLTDSKGLAWAMQGNVPQVPSSGVIPASAGPFTVADFYQLPANGPLCFTGDFTAYFVFVGPTGTGNVLFSLGSCFSGAGHGAIVSGNVVGAYLSAQDITAPGTPTIPGAVNVVCYGREGTTGRLKVNLGLIRTATVPLTTDTAAVPKLGRYNTAANPFVGTIIESGFLNVPCTDVLATRLANAVKSALGITAW